MAVQQLSKGPANKTETKLMLLRTGPKPKSNQAAFVNASRAQNDAEGIQKMCLRWDMSAQTLLNMTLLFLRNVPEVSG